MRGFIRIGRILGIPIGINPSWFLLLILVVTTLATRAFPSVFGDEPAWVLWLLALAASMAFFASMVLHELGHSIVARYFGIPVRSITLFVLGAVAQTTRESRRPGHEFLMAAAGPAVSFLLAGAFMVLWFVTGQGGTTVSVIFEWLWLANFAVGVFNMVPAYPMDGGRVLRSALWGLTGSQRRATHWAAWLARGIAFVLIGIGMLVALRVPWFEAVHPLNGLQFMLVGVFITFAARQGDAQSGILDFLSTYTVADVMLRDLPVARADTPVREALAGPLAGYGEGREWLMVSDGSRFVGLAARAAMLAMPDAQWLTARVGDVLIPVGGLRAVSPDEPLNEVLQRMEAEDAPVMMVVRDGQVEGLVHRGLVAGLMPREGGHGRG